MREGSINEFEALFERASVPVLDIAELALTRFAVVLKGAPVDESALAFGDYFRRRFDAQVVVTWPDNVDLPASPEDLHRRGLQPLEQPFRNAAELIGQLSLAHAQMIVLPEPQEDWRRVVPLEDFIGATMPPTLLIRGDVDPARTFRNILHSLSGNFQQTENFAYSFTLVESGGELLLYHAIDSEEIDDVRSALRLTGDLGAADRAELLTELTRHGERYLKAVVAASEALDFNVGYRLEVGNVAELSRRQLERGRHTLVVVGRHVEGKSYVTAEDYRLMHEVRDIPVLAL